LVVDADAVLSGSITAQHFQAVTEWTTFLAEEGVEIQALVDAVYE
jgi:hypothetical protein